MRLEDQPDAVLIHVARAWIAGWQHQQTRLQDRTRPVTRGEWSQLARGVAWLQEDRAREEQERLTNAVRVVVDRLRPAARS